jgi:hypothetical protein
LAKTRSQQFAITKQPFRPDPFSPDIDLHPNPMRNICNRDWRPRLADRPEQLYETL